ncbi:MAG: ribonuclease III [Gammaproteobacteria bacterium]|nr:ribonuclease III [Gammaproteobacteria bacterium]
MLNALDYRFNDVELFRQALTHRSAQGPDNERLEFLGDAVLDFVISEALFKARPDLPEGDLSRLRSSLVKDTSLAALAADIGLGMHLILGGGERKTGGHRRESILADALEAIFAAVFLDSGIDTAKNIIERVFADRLAELPDVDELRDPKTRLQEWLQARKMGLPEYELVSVSGLEHRQQFEVSCRVEGAPAKTFGTSTTRRKAEQQAAARMLSEVARVTA